jgi:hypothetical protein
MSDPYEQQTKRLRTALMESQASASLYASIIGVMVRSYKAEEGMFEADGNICIPIEDLATLPDVATVRIEQAVMDGEGPDDPEMPVVVLIVDAVKGEPRNGSSLVLPRRPGLTL